MFTDMKNRFLLVAILLGLSLSAFSQDLSVFDLKLNEPFDIRECNYEGMDAKVQTSGIIFSSTKKVKMYKYTEKTPATGKCFQRVGIGYTIPTDTKDPTRKELPPVTPIVNSHLKLMYADNLRPTIAESEDIWIGVQKARLTGIRFYFPGVKANDIYKILVKKYGNQASVESFYITNGLGGRKDYYVAKWEFPKLTVTLRSLDTNKIGFDPAAPSDWSNGFDNTVGSVTVQYLLDDKPKETNPF